MWATHEGHSCVAAGVHDGVVSVEHAVAQLVLPQELPDVFHGVQLGAVGRQAQQGEVARHAQAPAGLVPARPIEHQQRMVTEGHGLADLGQVQVHHLAVGERQHQARAHAALGAHRPEQVGPLVEDPGA